MKRSLQGGREALGAGRSGGDVGAAGVSLRTSPSCRKIYPNLGRMGKKIRKIILDYFRRLLASRLVPITMSP